MSATAGPGLDPKAFRQALGSFTTGVTIITTRDGQGQPIGLTANSFNSVSLDPPMVLWSLAKSARSLQAFEAAEHWAVHILSAEQEHLSNRFASRGEDKFAGVAVEPGIGGLPLLPECTTRLQCKTSFRYEGGDHIIFVGEVLAFDCNPVAPLVFHAGNYAMATRRTGPPPQRGTSGLGEDFLYFLLPRAHFQTYARLRRVHEAKGLNDAEFFVLACLATRKVRALAELEKMYTLSGQRLTLEQVQSLEARGLLTHAGPSDNTLLHATVAGRDLALHVLAESKAIESEILSTFSPWEVPAFKSQLRQLAQATSDGMPDAWDLA